MTQEIRQLQDKVIRQTSTLSTGLQDLRTYLDQKEQERSQTVSTQPEKCMSTEVVIDVVLVFFLLTLNIFHTFF